MTQCAEGIGICIYLGNDRPARNLKMLECTGPSGLAMTINAISTESPPLTNDEQETAEDDEDIDARLRDLDAGPMRREGRFDRVTVRRRQSQCVDEVTSNIDKRFRPNPSIATPAFEGCMPRNLVNGPQVTDAATSLIFRDTNSANCKSVMIEQQSTAMASPAEVSLGSVTASESVEEPDHTAEVVHSASQSVVDIEEIDYWNELHPHMESINEGVKL